MTIDNGATYDPITALAAREIFALINKNAPYPPSDEPLDHYGPYAGAIRDFRVIHRQAQEMMLRGEMVDPWYDSALLWDGYRQEEGIGADYQELDELVRKIGGLPPSKANKIQFIVKPHIISAAALRRKEFPHLVWTIDGILPEGLCILAGKPKSKKSWLALGIAVSVACGGRAFGYYDVTLGRVLYLDLESNQRRMQSRLQGIISGREAWPDNFDIATEWPRGEEGIAMLDEYCNQHPDTRLAVIDIWARFRAARDPKADSYEQDYNALQALNAWAESRNITVIVIHHTRKAKSDDVFEEISGTTGIVGAVATAMHLSRSPDIPDEQLLNMTGRDLIVDEPIALKWDNYTCQHLYVATGAEASSSAERRKILAVMDDDQEYHLKDLAAAIGKSMKALDNHLRRLMDDRLIHRTGRGRYAKIPQQSTELQVDVDNVELRASMDSMDSMDSSSLNIPHDDQGHGIAHGIGLAQQNGVNPQFHEFHGDSEGTPNHIEYPAEFQDDTPTTPLSEEYEEI